MIRRTLYFGNPAYLKTKEEQLVFEKRSYWRNKKYFFRKISECLSQWRYLT